MSAALDAFNREPPFAGLGRPGLHEVYAPGVACAASGLGLALGLVRGRGDSRPWLWVWHEALEHEIGRPFLPGLAEWGLDPSGLVLARAGSVKDALQAGLEGARCAGLGAVVISLWGEARGYDLVASRRLALAARAHGGCVLMVRAGAQPVPSAAETRWQVAAAPSAALAAQAPGVPAFALALLRHRGGYAPEVIVMEWNRDAGCFSGPARSGHYGATPTDASLSGAVVPVVRGRSDRPDASAEGGRRAG